MLNMHNGKIEPKKPKNFTKKENKETLNARRAILGALEDLELSNTALKQRTTELQLSEKDILQKKL